MKNPNATEQKELIRSLLRDGADVHETDKNGVTPLHHAVRFRSPAAVDILIRNGADVNRPCRRSGSTPLHRDVTYTGAPSTAGKVTEHREIIELLVAAGADSALANRDGRTALDFATDSETRALLRGKG
tara:strand:+ start:81 stop:467 length:387 start_codon:yes stop_codon:yes gene_type:complete